MTQPQPCLGGFEELVTTEAKPALQAKFIVPPFSILDTRQGYWQERKRLWMSLGIQSEIGREGLTNSSLRIDHADPKYAADLSNMSWNTFKAQYSEIIKQSILHLNNNRFACFVVSEIRDDSGFYKGLVPYTIDCFRRNGMWYYNEIILVNTVGSLPVRIEGQFGSYRKIGRTHQNILVFYKGDAALIPRYFRNIDGDIPSLNNDGTG